MTVTEEWFRRHPSERPGDHKVRLGSFAEKVWETILVQAGYRMFLLHKIHDGTAPLMVGKEKLIAPDFDAIQPCPLYRHSVYIDSKCKTGPVLWRTKNEWRHGINSRNREHYAECAKIADKSAGLALLELFTDERNPVVWSGALLVQSLKSLGPGELGFNEPIQKVYWPRKAFKVLGHFGPAALGEMARGAYAPDFGIQLGQVFAPKIQGDLFGDCA